MSVYGTDTLSSQFRSFSRQRSHSKFSEGCPPDTLHLSELVWCGFANTTSYGLRPTLSTVGSPDFLRPSITLTRRYRNINLSSIDYAFRPRLRFRLTPGGRTFPGKPWVFGDRNSHPVFATHACMVTCMRSTSILISASIHIQRSSTTVIKSRSAASVLNFSPDHLRRDITRPVSYYALFK